MVKRVSYGIALCRYNEHRNNMIEILSVRKPCTYEFISVVCGAYKNNEIYTKIRFDRMSVREKLVLLMHNNFSFVWYYLYTQDFSVHAMEPTNNIKLYSNRKRKYESVLFAHKKRMADCILSQTDSQDPIWEIPKGSKNKNEDELVAAMREFGEETGVPSIAYTVLDTANPLRFSFVDCNIEYEYIYFIATATKEISPRIDLSNSSQTYEVDNIQWLAPTDLNAFKYKKDIKGRLRHMYKSIIARYKTHKVYKSIKFHTR
jgi:8-oxo-dGTP pyrophosphatase MutT (NUDIX family)